MESKHPLEILHEEDGMATMMFMFTLAIAALLLVMVITPSLNNFASRRVSQNGVDAGAHAAAGKIADDLSVSYGMPPVPGVPYIELSMALCPSGGPPMSLIRDTARRRAVEFYQAYYLAYINTSGAPRAEAAKYARNNRSDLVNYMDQVSPLPQHSNFQFHHQPTGKTLYPIYVDAETKFTFTPWTERTFDVPAYAGAIAYITKVEAPIDSMIIHPFIVDPSTGAPCFTWWVMYKYSWEINLIKRFSLF